MQYSDSRARLAELVRDIRFAMFTTRDAQGALQSRPMTTQGSRLDDDGVWFFMSRSSDPVRDLAHDANVNVAYADPDRDAYVSLSGTARVVDDPERRRALWSKMNEAWFPNGPDDPDVALVRVEIASAELWDVRESKPSQLLQMAKAAITGQRPHLGDHARVPMGGDGAR